MCPDSILLVAYLDGTLHRREAADVEQHVETCVRCATLLDDMRRARGYGRRSRWPSPLMIAAAAALVAIAGLGSWIGLTRSRSVPPPLVTATSTRTEAAGARLSAPPSVPAKPVVASLPPEAASPRSPRGRDRAAETHASVKAGAVTARTQTASPADRIDGGVVLRGRRANRNIIWRVRDRIVEHSVDGGTTWTGEHASDRAIRAGAFVDANVAWLGGDRGLVLRRTKNGWFSASPPADAAITAVRASSPSKATVTLDDGRVFATENGGVSWSEAPRDK